PVLPGPRFTMLETVREYALDLLAASGEEETVRRRHAAWCLIIAERVEADAFAGGWERSLETMDPEYDNLRSALGWATRRSGEATTVGLRLACALWLFWFQRGHADEGRRWFARALANAEDNATALAGKAQLGMASLIGAGGDLAGAMAVGQDCLALYQSLDDRLGVARSFQLIGSTAHQLGDLVRAVSCLEQAIAGYVAEGGEQIWLATATAELGVIAYCRGQRDLAASLLDRAAAIQRELGPTWPSMFTVPSLNQLAAPGPGAATMPAAAAGAGPAARLSPREQEILRLIATGQTNQAIAGVLCISPRTVSTHAANILSKLDLASRAEAIAFAYRHRLV
ncbi:MAG: tetratricopeptide repeat protein, partial [Chloroflexia bacterium]|nr:tetratricopeptide repeat protein [Chloroflexia bacterium]